MQEVVYGLKMRHRGIEPRPSRWQRDIITTRLMTLYRCGGSSKVRFHGTEAVRYPPHRSPHVGSTHRAQAKGWFGPYPRSVPEAVPRCRRSQTQVAKTYVTCDSRVVPHRSTVQAHSCLTSEFGWDPVLSARYERTMQI